MLSQNKQQISLILCFFLASGIVFAQQKKKQTNKGKMFVYWGWNRANYSDSDIHFKGENYDFTLSNVKAKDKVTRFSFYDYFHPTRIYNSINFYSLIWVGSHHIFHMIYTNRNSLIFMKKITNSNIGLRNCNTCWMKIIIK